MNKTTQFTIRHYTRMFKHAAQKECILLLECEQKPHKQNNFSHGFEDTHMSYKE
jgi:hypothetical protein